MSCGRGTRPLPTYHQQPVEDIFREAMKLLKPELPIKIRLMVRFVNTLHDVLWKCSIFFRK